MTTMKTEELQILLERLDGEPADALESEALEFKSWRRSDSYARKIQSVREAAVAFANANGGALVLGVADAKRSRADAIQGVDELDIADLRRQVYEGTDPHILVDVEEVQEPEGRIVLMRIPRGTMIHTTTDGLAKIRIGKASQPLTGSNLRRILDTRGGSDFTAVVVPGTVSSELDTDQLLRLRRMIDDEGSNTELIGLSDSELLEALGLTFGDQVTRAGILMLGHRAAIARHVPHHEVSFVRFRAPLSYDLRRDFRGPILQVIDEIRDLMGAVVPMTLVQTNGFRELEIPEVSWQVAREALLNALIHRDYFLSQSIQFEIHSDRAEIISPGGFIADVTPHNILRHRPARRNELLASALQSIGLVNRLGLGIDRIFGEMLRLGKELPTYFETEAYVQLVLPTLTHQDFVRFVYDTSRSGDEIERDDLIVLRSLITRHQLDRRSAAHVLQLSEPEAVERLASLREREYLDVAGRGATSVYRLADPFSRWIEEGTYGTVLRDQETVRSRLLSFIADQGSITNADIRRISGLSRTETVRLARAMRDEGLIEVRGRGRGAHYVLRE